MSLYWEQVQVLPQQFGPIAHFAGYDMPAAPIKTGVTGISTF